jgi:hypothetical protein
VDLLPLDVGVLRHRAEQRADVGEGGEHLVLGGQQDRVGGVQLLGGGDVVVHQARGIGHADVEAEGLVVDAFQRLPHTGHGIGSARAR